MDHQAETEDFSIEGGQQMKKIVKIFIPVLISFLILACNLESCSHRAKKP